MRSIMVGALCALVMAGPARADEGVVLYECTRTITPYGGPETVSRVRVAVHTGPPATLATVDSAGAEWCAATLVPTTIAGVEVYEAQCDDLAVHVAGVVSRTSARLVSHFKWRETDKSGPATYGIGRDDCARAVP